MKSAMEWLTDPSVKQRTSEADVVAWIQAIQADALRHASKEALHATNFPEDRGALMAAATIIRGIADTLAPNDKLCREQGGKD